jgi:hypothetical protein
MITTGLDDFLDKLEAAPLALATKFGPWLTPLVPAYFVQRAMTTTLHAPSQWGWLAAAALEVVGIAATNSLLRAYQWEKERRKIDPAAPLWWNVAACTVYYGTAFLLVFFLEIWPTAIKLAPAAFVILSGTSALVLALVGDQKRRERLVGELSDKRQADRSAKRYADTLPTGQADRSLTGEVNTPDIDRLQAGRRAKQQAAEQKLLTYITHQPDFTHNEAAHFVGRSRPWVSDKLKEFEDSGVIKKNGHGYNLQVSQ